MNWTKILFINTLVFFGFVLVILVLAELYYREVDSRLEAQKSSIAFFDLAYPETNEGSISTLVTGHYRRIGPEKEFDYEFDINEFGYKEPNFDPSRPVDVLIFGDSFTFGHGVSPEKRFSAIIAQHRPDLNIANMAYNAGFTAPHYLLYFNNKQMLNPKKILVFTYLGNDCQSDIAETEIISDKIGGYPLRIIEGGRPVGRKSSYPNIVTMLSDFSVVFQKIFSRIYNSRWGHLVFNIKARPNYNNSRLFDLGDDPAACARNLNLSKNLLSCANREIPRVS